MTDPLRVGIIGGGWIARVHVPAIDAAPGLELVAACDTAIERAEAISGPRGGTAYASWEEMLAHEQLDALWICTPPLHHRGPVEAALGDGVHVYLEKPIARTLEDADAIVAAASASSAICAVGYQYHASELLDDALALLEGQQVGLLVSRNFGPVAGRPWFMDRAQGGGQILERASHHIDLQQALAGPISSVQATAGSVDLSQTELPNGIEDAIALVFHFEGGALGTVHSAWTRAGQPELYGVDVVASDATLALQLGPEAFRLTGRSAGADVASERGEPMDRSIARFVEAVRRRDQSLVACQPAQARDTLAVALACERALESGRVVEVAR
jgi:myo-inositol 2-dehydrogenase/D-chiro-inositol 1-dehydrogenase